MTQIRQDPKFFHFKITTFIAKIFDYIYPNINLVTSNKSNTRSITRLCFWKENMYAFVTMSTTSSKRWLPDKQWTKNHVSTADWSLQDNDINASLLTLDELGVEADEAILQQRSQGILYLLVARKELPPAKQQHSIGVQTARQRDLNHHQTRLALLHHTRYQERGIKPHLQFGPIWSKARRTN